MRLWIVGAVVAAVAAAVAVALLMGRPTTAERLVGTWSGVCLPSPRAETLVLRFEPDGTGVAGATPRVWALDDDLLVLTDPSGAVAPVRLRVAEADDAHLLLTGDGTATSSTVRCTFDRT